MPELTVEERDDLIPSCCRGGCVVEVVAGVHNGVPAYWVQHGTESRAVTTGAEALETLARLHEEQKPDEEPETGTAADGLVEVPAASGTSDIEAAPI